MPEITTHELLSERDYRWQFADIGPTWRHRRYGQMVQLDPFPAYRQDMIEVQAAVQHVQAACPPLWDVELFAADREDVGRSNGFSWVHEGQHYDETTEEWIKDPPVGLIFLAGKRVPPHPALARYLVAHEYGHNVEWMINKVRGRHLLSDDTATEYATLRGLPTPIHAGSGGRWHDAVAEVFACDFRIIVCGIELEYWPHPGVARPDGPNVTADVRGWWRDAVRDLKAAG